MRAALGGVGASVKRKGEVSKGGWAYGWRVERRVGPGFRSRREENVLERTGWNGVPLWRIPLRMSRK